MLVGWVKGLEEVITREEKAENGKQELAVDAVKGGREGGWLI
jgi:hypothetical protein